MAIGLLISCIGMSPQTGLSRFVFRQVGLMEGIPLIPMLIGLFGITSIFEMVELIKKPRQTGGSGLRSAHGSGQGLFDPAAGIKKEDIQSSYKLVKVCLPNWSLAKRLLPIWAQSSILGNIIGIIPGAGMIMAIFMAYDMAQKRRPKLEFGTGVPEGIAAPESANNAVVASSMVPLLSLGVPGNSTSSLFLGALTIQGFRTGPGLFRDSPDMAYLILLGFLLSNIIMLPLSLVYTRFFATAVLKLRREILAGVVLALCVTGAFAVSNSVFNIGIMISFGVIGYLFNKYKIPQAPLILASILGTMMESNWTQSMVFADGSLSVFITRPLSLALLVISALFVFVPLAKLLKETMNAAHN
jgi:putative tricarboxylic transport membrane protein